MKKIAILDDYQGVALQSADWPAIHEQAEITLFSNTLDDADALVQRLLPFDAICVMRERTALTREVLAQLPNLKFIASNAPHNAAIDLAAAQRLGITVSSTGARGNGAPELTWALILAAARHIVDQSTSLRTGHWQSALGKDLEGHTLGLIGLGRIGKRVAAVGQAFGMEVLAWSPNLAEQDAVALGVKPVPKAELLQRADWVSLHLVLSENTRGILSAPDLARMQAHAWLINTARGPLVDEAALIDALSRRAIGGAALDVFDKEPLPANHPFRTLNNVLATPHIGFVTEDTYRLFYGETVENLLAWLDGAPIRVMR